MKITSLLCVGLSHCLICGTEAFRQVASPTKLVTPSTAPSCRQPSFLLADAGGMGGEDSADLLLVKSTLEQNYPNFYQILQKNDAVWKALAGAEAGGFTIFAPNTAAFQALGQNKWDQLLDARNLEQTEKVGAYHVIAETVTADQLYNRYV